MKSSEKQEKRKSPITTRYTMVNEKDYFFPALTHEDRITTHGDLVLSIFSVLTAAFFYLLSLGFNFNMPKHFFNHFFLGGGPGFGQ